MNAFAIDENDNIENISILVRIELTTHWLESNTNNPEPLKIEPIPNNNAIYPEMIEVFSKVENPSIISDFGGGGQSVEFLSTRRFVNTSPWYFIALASAWVMTMPKSANPMQ